MPPEVDTTKLVAPDGTCTEKLALLFVAPERPVWFNNVTEPPTTPEVLNAADTLELLVPAGIVQLPVPLHAPPQPPNVLPLSACADRVTAAVMEKLAIALEHDEPQLKPLGLLLTVPVPLPDLVSEITRVEEAKLKVAVTLLALAMVTLQLLDVPEHAPLQPANVLPAVACAVKVTCVFAEKLLEQVLPQLMPAGELVTVPLPVPWRETDKV